MLIKYVSDPNNEGTDSHCEAVLRNLYYMLKINSPEVHDIKKSTYRCRLLRG